MDILGRYVAVDDKCAWPNLTLMPDGSIVATIFSEPCHHQWEGDIECWRSRDGGRTWTFLSVAAPHAPGTNQITAAAGLTHSGAFVVLSTGLTTVAGRGKPPLPFKPDWLVPMVSRSEDGGKTWTRTEMKIPSQIDYVIPFGDIVKLPGNRLAFSGYSVEPKDIDRNTAWVYFSDDDGRTWGDARTIGADSYNETALLSIGDGKLLAACRTAGKRERTEVFASEDGGRTWKCRGPVTLMKECPANLCRLADGSILLTYGVRLRGMLGVCARISGDEGLTWDAPRVLFGTEARESNTNPGGVDGGYPSSVQLDDGTIVTAYYCSRIPMHQRYHMGVVLWRD